VKLGLIVARTGIVREGLVAMLRAIPGIEVIEPVDDGNSALGVVGARRVDLVVLDSSLSDQSLWKKSPTRSCCNKLFEFHFV
jgi:DNA-binding NarL/FixJ family response regulator